MAPAHCSAFQHTKVDVTSNLERELILCVAVSSLGLQLLAKAGHNLDPSAVKVLYPTLNNVTQGERDSMHRLQVSWEPSREFLLWNLHGFKKISACTLVEDVSFVVSIYLPDCLLPHTHDSRIRYPSNDGIAKEVSELVKKADLDDILDDRLHVGGVKVLLSEWIPFGGQCNH